MQLPSHEQLDTVHLQRLFDNMSECYKLFWFQAIVEKVYAGKTVLTYDELINNMIADAWYMVTEYKLNLGPADNLEDLVHYAQRLFGLKSSEKKETVLSALENCQDRELLRRKQILTYNVPYRLQAPFMPRPLQKAHQANDKAVMAAYGFSVKEFSESVCVDTLMKMYQERLAEEM